MEQPILPVVAFDVMEVIKCYDMKTYCIHVRERFEALSPLEVQLYGDKLHELRSLIAGEKTGFDFCAIAEDMQGRVTRILQGRYKNLAHIDWVGSNTETLSKETYVKTMAEVWPELLKS